VQTAKKAEVTPNLSSTITISSDLCFSWRKPSLDYRRNWQNQNKSWRANSLNVPRFRAYYSLVSFTVSENSYRTLEAQANEKLQNVYHQLLQANVDKNESEKERKLKEMLSNLQRIFPGMCSRRYAEPMS